MTAALLVICFLCIAAIPVLVAVMFLWKEKGRPVKLLSHGIWLLLLLAVCAFVLGMLLRGAGA